MGVAHNTFQGLPGLTPLLQNRPLFQVICPGYLWARDKRWFLSRVQRLAGPAGDRGLLSRLEVPTRTKGGPFVPVGGSIRDKRPNPFIPVGNTNPDKRVTLLSRLVVPTGTKGPFCPGWCYQPGQKAPPRDSSKGSYSLLSHMYYLGELVRKPCASQLVLGSNPAGRKDFLARGTFCPGSTTRDKNLQRFCPGGLVPVSKPRQIALWNRDKWPDL